MALSFFIAAQKENRMTVHNEKEDADNLRLPATETVTYNYLENNPEINKKLWRKIILLALRKPIKMTPYDFDCVIRTGLNPAAMLLSAIEKTMAERKENRTYTENMFHNSCWTISLSIYLFEATKGEKDRSGASVTEDHERIECSFRYYERSEDDDIIFEYENEHLLVKRLPDIIKTQLAGRKVSELIETPYLPEATIINAYEARDTSKYTQLRIGRMDKDDLRFFPRDIIPQIEEYLQTQELSDAGQP